MNRDTLVESGLGLLILVLQWMWAHWWTLAEVLFAVVVLYKLSEIRRLVLGGWSGFGVLATEITELKDAVEDLKGAIDDLKFELPDKDDDDD